MVAKSNIYFKKAILVSVGGLLIGSMVINGEIILATIMRAVETVIGIFQNKIIVVSNIYNLMIASASTSAILIQRNRENMGVRKERSKWEIIEDMLKVLVEEKKSKKTRIMQRACLDWRNFQRYFGFLLEGGFIAKSNPEMGSYELTQKGNELLKRLKYVDEILH